MSSCLIGRGLKGERTISLIRERCWETACVPVCVSTAHAHHAGGMSSKQRAVAQREKQEVCGVHAHGVLSGGDGSSHAETLMDAGRLR